MNIDKSLMKVFDDMVDKVPELKEGIAKRKAAARECARKDAAILNKPEEELAKLYQELFFNICTDELLDGCIAATAQERWNVAEPLTWPNSSLS